MVVYGGHGFFGRILLDDLIANTGAGFIIAGRHPVGQPSLNPRVRFVTSDLNELGSVRATLAGAALVVNCAGPYQDQPLHLPQEAAAQGVHYLDLAEDRQFVRRAQACDALARRTGAALVSGLSVVPGLAALLAQIVARDFDQLLAVRTFVAPGTRGSRGTATVRTLLSGAGRPLRLWRRGRETAVRGWSEPEWIEFPPPIGWRLQYQAIEAADQDEFSRNFGAQSVEFKAGSEFPWLNRGLALAAWMRAHTRFPPLDRWAGAMRRGLRLIGRFGTDRGGVLVEVSGSRQGVTGVQQIAVTAEERGERIPSLLAAITAAALLRGELTGSGALPLRTLLAPAHLFSELHRRGLRTWLRPDSGSVWQPFEIGP